MALRRHYIKHISLMKRILPRANTFRFLHQAVICSGTTQRAISADSIGHSTLIIPLVQIFVLALYASGVVPSRHSTSGANI